MFAVFVAAVACHPNTPDSDARTRLITVLRDSLGRAGDPNVAFITDGGHPGSHLYLTFDTSAVPATSESDFEGRARDLARLAVRHYEKASNLDSVTVATRESWQPGIWRVQHKRAFAVAGLKDAGAP